MYKITDRITFRLRDEEVVAILSKIKKNNTSGIPGGVSEFIRRCIKFYDYNTRGKIRAKYIQYLLWIQDLLFDIEEDLILLYPNYDDYMEKAKAIMQWLLINVKLMFK